MCFKFKKTSRKELGASPGSWAGASWMRTSLRRPSHGVNTRRGPPRPASPTQLERHAEPGENAPRERPNLGPCPQARRRRGGRRGQEDEEATLWLIPPAQSRTDRARPAPAETGRPHFSGTDIRDRGGNF